MMQSALIVDAHDRTSFGTHPNTNADPDQTPFRAHTSHTNRTESDPSKSPDYHAS